MIVKSRGSPENSDLSLKDKLSIIGVDYAQGYSIGRPKPIEESILLATA